MARNRVFLFLRQTGSADVALDEHLRPPAGRFTHGKGAWLTDEDGQEYLDALAGIAVNGLGHAHPELTAALAEQVGRLIHTSNIYRVREQEALADRICDLTGMDEVFFGNSGSEANEGAIKLARLYGHQHGNPEAADDRHGERLARPHARHAVGHGQREGAGRVRAAAWAASCACRTTISRAIERLPRATRGAWRCWLEVLQGEGGIHVADADYLRELRALCDDAAGSS